MKAVAAAPDRLFVYGSLLTGTPDRRLNHAMRRALRRARPAMIGARLYDLGTYPGAVADARERVYGRLISLTDPGLLRQLDRYEDCFPGDLRHSEFIRVRTRANYLGSRRAVRCWVYFYHGNISGRPPIRHGDYVRSRSEGRLIP